MKHLTVSLALALAIAAFAASPAAADGTGFPGHQIGAVECGPGYVKTLHPRSMVPTSPTDFRNPEEVQWSPDLWRWNGASWVLHDGSRPWYRAYTSSTGYFQTSYTASAWQAIPTNAPLLHVAYSYLPPGYYAIRNYLWWGWLGRTHSEFSAYCWVS
jgi:hypothetical protein